MKAKNIAFMDKLANDRITEKQNKLELLLLLQKYEGYTEFGYTKEELERKIAELKEYIYIATH